MDILAHGLWAGVAYKAINKKSKRPLSVKLAAFWGVFPDLLAFTIGFVWLFGSLLFGDMSLSDLPRPDSVEPAPRDTLLIFRLTSLLYSLSHSAIIFLIVFGIVYLVFRRPVWELGGWFIHILLDIPTHSYQFYPTPFLWPLSDWKFDGFSWGTPWFLIPNYIAIIGVYPVRKKAFDEVGGIYSCRSRWFKATDKRHLSNGVYLLLHNRKKLKTIINNQANVRS